MKDKKILVISAALSAAILFVLSSSGEVAELTPEIAKQSKYAVDNEAVHMVGCQALPKEAAPRIILPPVVKTFVSLPCATEVPPPLAAIEHKRLME